MAHSFARGTAVALSLVSAAALAQQAPRTALQEVTVTGNPLGDDDVSTPVQQYSGTGLLLRGQSTLGETLNATPGVSSTYFGPTASRPIIRGLDGDRVRILSNSGAAFDASGVSYDHAVSADPITIERIEVLRGPGALLYGGNAVGGVVNLIDNRIPREPLDGTSGRAHLSYASGAAETAGAVHVDSGNDRLGLHADAFSRRSDDVAVPAALACAQGGVTRVRDRICNSAARTSGGAVGGSMFFDGGYLGASLSTYQNDYGAVAEDEASIRMRSNRLGVEGEWRRLPGPFESVKLQASRTDYRHTEYDAGVPGTVFRTQGNDLRLQARHRPLGPVRGVVGLQVESSRFSADGEETFAPYSRTGTSALYAFEELARGDAKYSFGARAEQARVESLGHPVLERFAPAQRRFTPVSASVAGSWKLAPEWQWTASLAHTERAPRDYELFANGPHLATAAFEIGNPTLSTERSASADAGLQWRRGSDRAEVRAWTTSFANYVTLFSTGVMRQVDGAVVPELAYRAARARFTGGEANGSVRLPQVATGTWDLEWRADIVRASNRDTGEPLPRIAPARAGATLAWNHEALGLRVGFDSYAAQRRVPAGDLPTPGYTLWNAALTWRQQATAAGLLWYARLDNAADKLASSASSILTQTEPGRVPLPGRSLKVGVQASF